MDSLICGKGRLVMGEGSWHYFGAGGALPIFARRESFLTEKQIQDLEASDSMLWIQFDAMLLPKRATTVRIYFCCTNEGVWLVNSMWMGREGVDLRPLL